MLSPMTTETRQPLTLLTVQVTDPTSVPADVIAEAECNSVHEVYPDDHEPTWVTPSTCTPMTPAVLSAIIAAARVGLETADGDLDAETLAAAWDALNSLGA